MAWLPDSPCSGQADTHIYTQTHRGQGHVCVCVCVEGGLWWWNGVRRESEAGGRRGTERANLEQSKMFVNSDERIAEQNSKSKAVGGAQIFCFCVGSGLQFMSNPI